MLYKDERLNEYTKHSGIARKKQKKAPSKGRGFIIKDYIVTG
jgi:hypothetical protein